MKSLYILYSKEPRIVVIPAFLNLFEELELSVYEEPTQELPGGYDSYLIHIQDTSLEAIEKLRKESPHSLVCALFGGGKADNFNLRTIKLFDRTFYGPAFEEKDAQEILRKLNEVRQPWSDNE